MQSAKIVHFLTKAEKIPGAQRISERPGVWFCDCGCARCVFPASIMALISGYSNRTWVYSLFDITAPPDVVLFSYIRGYFVYCPFLLVLLKKYAVRGLFIKLLNSQDLRLSKRLPFHSFSFFSTTRPDRCRSDQGCCNRNIGQRGEHKAFSSAAPDSFSGRQYFWLAKEPAQSREPICFDRPQNRPSGARTMWRRPGCPSHRY